MHPPAQGGSPHEENEDVRVRRGRRWFVSGVYLGHGRAGRVEVTTAKAWSWQVTHCSWPGTRWGAFFVVPSAALPSDSAATPHLHVGVTKVVVYDTEGGVITSDTYPAAS